MAVMSRATGLVLLIVLLALGAGCATSPGSFRTTSAAPDQAAMSKYSDVTVDVGCSKGVPLAISDMDRIKALIAKNIPDESSNRYKCVEGPAAGSNTIAAKVTITRYDEGNATARLMLAGLGQMHIDADIALSDFTTGELLFRSEVKKTFAWGGLYGGSAQITDIEEGFSRAVAASLANPGKN